MADPSPAESSAGFGEPGLFDAPYAEDDSVLAKALLDAPLPSPEVEARVDARTRDLVSAIRDGASGIGGVEQLLREYSLSTREGLALMVLAEALLRVPDAATTDELIEDKLGQGDFAGHHLHSDAILISASVWALGVTSRLIQPHETPEGVIAQAVKRLGVTAVRAAMRQAMRVMANHFVLGQTIHEALQRTQSSTGRAYRYSFDMLGEGARTSDDAARYFAAYADAIEAIGGVAEGGDFQRQPGISIKLSALHPRFEAVSRQRVKRELVPRVIELARMAMRFNLNFTIDAEEADRLELSLDVIGSTLADPSMNNWDGFGIAVQAYQKRARTVIAWIDDIARASHRRLAVRLVKGAYWDTEVKRAQERGLDDYPVFTRKAMTDWNYLDCATRLLRARDRLFPQFATHNALTVASIVEQAGDVEGYEFQRLHGMGKALYDRLIETGPDVACRVYAPVGGHRDLLAYLVRRLLENGANSAFVSLAADPAVPVERLLLRPHNVITSPDAARSTRLPLPRNLYGPGRLNSRGVEFGHRKSIEALLNDIEAERRWLYSAAPIIDGQTRTGRERVVVSPSDPGIVVGRVVEAGEVAANDAMNAAQRGFDGWRRTSAATRADVLDRAADLLESRRGRFIHLMQAEGGKTIDDTVSEVREAVDFCRYYAAQGRLLFGVDETMPGPTGESNVLTLSGRGVFVAISPWNFPLAIFIGQISAALMAGNALVAKPAEQTPLIAAEAVRLLHEAGVPATALHLVPGDGSIGATLTAHRNVSGVVFTGSTEVARLINRVLAAKDGPIVPLIAETGGINAMIVDATALPEQVADDVMTSAFRSAGQRCSALRLLFVQDDVADAMIRMIVGAARKLTIGDPRLLSTHVGPVIDSEAKSRLETHIAKFKTFARVHYAGSAPPSGLFVAPHVFELKDASELTEEVFGPVLHVVRYREDDLEAVLQAIEATGYGLTLGIHSRIDAKVQRIAERLAVGNIYVNRNMIGAVVGVQPFGGSGLSGTGPKAGGLHYLLRFASEKTVTVNTAAAGGNVDLMSKPG